MILDSLLQFDAAINLAQVAGTYSSTNIIDLGVNGLPLSSAGGGARDIGIGDDPALKLVAQVTTAFTGGTSVQAVVQGAPDNGSGAPGAFTTMLNGPVVALANLIAGARILDDDMPRPVPGQAVPRFLRMQYILIGNFTAGIMESLLVLDRIDQIETTNAVLSGYPAGITVQN